MCHELRVLVVAVLAGWSIGGLAAEPAKKEGAAAPRVTVRQPVARQINDYYEANGWLDAVSTVDLRCQVKGYIQKISFLDGQMVKKGDLLIELDPRPFQADLESAQAQLGVCEAQKTGAEAKVKELEAQRGVYKAQLEGAIASKVLADVTVERYKVVVAAQADTQANLDSAVASAKVAAAQVEQVKAQFPPLEAQINTAQAQVEGAIAQINAAKETVQSKQLDLEWSKVTAPIDGKISKATWREGNLVGPDSAQPLATILSIDPVYVYFNIDERTLAVLMGSTRKSKDDIGRLRDAKVPFTFAGEGDKQYGYKGVLDYSDNKIDRTTGMILVRGIAENTTGHLIPGGRARVRMPMRAPYEALLVPDVAVQSDMDRKFLLVVGDDGLVIRRDIELGRLEDDGMRVILPPQAGKGLQKNDWVIVLGVQRARLHYPVEPFDADGKPVSVGAK